MNNQLKLLLYIVFVAAIFFFVQDRFSLFDVEFLSGEESKEQVQGEESEYVDIYNIDGNVIRVNIEVADDEFERESGLSNRRYLGDYDGMLFVFESSGGYPFWMKDMLIPLDVIFIDADGFIVDVRENLKPCNADFCPNVVSNIPFKYALEVNGGFVESNGVVVGNSVILNLESN